jgi:hypothetical protein
MKRINVFYDGQQYSVGDRDLSEVETQISDALVSGAPHWLDVNGGEGAPHAVRLLILPGIAIALSPVTTDERAPEYALDPVGDAVAFEHGLL